MNLKLMSVLPGFRYSSVAADLSGEDLDQRLVVDAARQIPRRTTGVRMRRGVSYRAGLRLDLMAPTAAGRHPLVVYVPGGGFVVARRAMGRRERAFVASAGYVVASVEYRTVRRHATYRDALTDIHDAVDHLVANAEGIGIDPARIAVWGESAGGYLASLAGLEDRRITAVVDQFGASDLTRVADGFDPRMREALADPKNPIRRYGAMDANPVDLVTAEAPAFLLLHGDDDRIIPPAQTMALHKALLAAGADSTRYLLADAGHGRLALSRAQARLWSSERVLTIVTNFLERHLRS